MLGSVQWQQGELLTSKRIHNGWGSWSKIVAEHGLGDQLVAPVTSKEATSEQDFAARFHVAGTAALLSLLLRWSLRALDSGLKAFAQHVLASLLKACLQGEDFEVKVERPVAGQLQIDDCMVWVSGMCSCPQLAHPQLDHELQRLQSLGFLQDGKAPLLRCLQALGGNRALTRHTALVLSCVAKVMEATFDEAFGACSDMLSSNFRPAKRSRLDYEVSESIALGELGEQQAGRKKPVRLHGSLVSRLWKGLKGTRGPSAPQDEVLLRYYLSSRFHLAGAKFMSVAMDAGRIGKLDLMCAVVVARSCQTSLPVAACMPPQAISKGRTPPDIALLQHRFPNQLEDVSHLV